MQVFFERIYPIFQCLSYETIEIDPLSRLWESFSTIYWNCKSTLLYPPCLWCLHYTYNHIKKQIKALLKGYLNAFGYILWKYFFIKWYSCRIIPFCISLFSSSISLFIITSFSDRIFPILISFMMKKAIRRSVTRIITSVISIGDFRK